MKRIISLALAFVMLLTLAACGGGQTPTTEPEKPLSSPSKSDYKSDVRKYLKEELDRSVKITSFEKENADLEDDTLTVSCIATYEVDGDESTATFILTYVSEDDGWELDDCFMKEEDSTDDSVSMSDTVPSEDIVVPETTMPPEPVYPDAGITLKVAAVETAYGSQVWADVADAFTAKTGIQVELTTDKNLEDVISYSMQSGDYPDVVHLALGRQYGLTEQLVKSNALHPLTNALNLTIPGEYVTPNDKIVPGFTDNSIVSPYGDGKTYMAPMFYSPCGLFYNARLFEEKGWTVPTTWDEMWALGDKAAAEGIYLFTYPTAGYLDAFLFALMNSIGGTEFFDSITTYEPGAWDSADGQKLLSILDKLITYTHPDTAAQANNMDFTKNQMMAMDGRALFMPNGTWITGEMADYAATLGNSFAWGMMLIPYAGEAPSAYSWFEQAWIPAGAEHIDEAELFIAFLYSDEAAQIFASAGAMQPILGIADMLEGENKMFYSIYNKGARAAMGGFAAFANIPGVSVTDTFFAPIDSLVSGTMTIDEYADLVKTNSALMRENLIG